LKSVGIAAAIKHRFGSGHEGAQCVVDCQALRTPGLFERSMLRCGMNIEMDLFIQLCSD